MFCLCNITMIRKITKNRYDLTHNRSVIITRAHLFHAIVIITRDNQNDLYLYKCTFHIPQHDV